MNVRPPSFGSRPWTTRLALKAIGRPVTGSTIQLATSDIPAGTIVGVAVMSFAQQNPGLPLASLGMPGCFQHLSLDATNLILPSGSSHNLAFSVPNVSAYNGLHLYCQSVTFSAGWNPLGALASNGLDVRLGTF